MGEDVGPRRIEALGLTWTLPNGPYVKVLEEACCGAWVGINIQLLFCLELVANRHLPAPITILYYTILYYTILYYTILDYTRLY